MCLIILDRTAVILFGYIDKNLKLSIIDNIKTLKESLKMKVIQTFTSPEANTFDVIVNDTVVAYYYEHFVNPETNEKLSTSVFELYYDFDEDEYLSSILTEDFDEIESILEELDENENFCIQIDDISHINEN